MADLIWSFNGDAIYLRADGMYVLTVGGEYVMASRSMIVASNYLYLEFGR